MTDNNKSYILIVRPTGRSFAKVFQMTKATKPKSWAELAKHPDIFAIQDDRKEFKDSGENEILIIFHDHVENPVTGELGGGFYAGSFKDALDCMNL